MDRATILVPSIGLEDIVAYIEAFTKFTQQALDDSWQNLSLLNTEMSLIEKLSSKVKQPCTLLLPYKEAHPPLSKENVVCSCLISWPLCHLY